MTSESYDKGIKTVTLYGLLSKQFFFSMWDVNTPSSHYEREHNLYISVQSVFHGKISDEGFEQHKR